MELFATRSRSIRLEYRIRHISNRGPAHENPGIDKGMFRVTHLPGR